MADFEADGRTIGETDKMADCETDGVTECGTIAWTHDSSPGTNQYADGRSDDDDHSVANDGCSDSRTDDDDVHHSVADHF